MPLRLPYKREPEEVPQKENPVRFHTTWVEIATLAAVDAVAVVTVVAEAVEDMARPHLVRCHVKHQKLGHART
jgi:hypothetical protein